MLYKTNSLDFQFIPWQPSTWPEFSSYTIEFKNTLKSIINETILLEIYNVINDACLISENKNIEHRGHVIALSILCAIDTISSYAYTNNISEPCINCGKPEKNGPKYKKYIQEFFPKEYSPYGYEIYKLFRCSITHNWNLFEGTMFPDDRKITINNGIIQLGLINLFNSLRISVDNFLVKLENDTELQNASLKNYQKLKNIAK